MALTRGRGLSPRPVLRPEVEGVAPPQSCVQRAAPGPTQAGFLLSFLRTLQGSGVRGSRGSSQAGLGPITCGSQHGGLGPGERFSRRGQLCPRNVRGA